MKAQVIILAALAGCGADRGFAVEITVRPGCQGAAQRIVNARFTVTAEPPVARPTFDVPGGVLLGTVGGDRVVLLLPEGTRRVAISAVALDGAGMSLGTSTVTDDLFFNGPAFRHTTLVLDETPCAMPIADAGTADLAGRDFPPGTDLRPSHSVIGAVAQGAFLNAIYEGEGSQLADPAAGVAVMITGSGFSPSAVVTTDYGTLGPVFVSPSGTNIATSLQLPVDTTLPMGMTREAQLTITQNGLPVTTKLLVIGLNELMVAPPGPLLMPALPDAPLLFSSVSVVGTLQLSGDNRGFLWVTGSITGGGTIDAVPTAGGKPGCGLIDLCSPGINGTGHGRSSTASVVNAGGGASFGTSGTQGGGSTGAPGDVYGDPSLIGLVGGSGGGSGGGMNSSGGHGGGVLRVWAGKIFDVNLRVDGETGKISDVVSGGGGGGGGGSGGALLVQSPGGLSGTTTHALSAQGGSGGMGVGGVSYTGGLGGGGRTRLDIGIKTGPSFYTAAPAIGFVGAMLASDFPSAFGSSLSAVKVICGTSFTIEVDGAQRSSGTVSCPGIGPLEATVTLATPIGSGMHRVCIKMTSSSPDLRVYPAPFEEDRNCRAIAVAAD